jgi:hypothetical protein
VREVLRIQAGEQLQPAVSQRETSHGTCEREQDAFGQHLPRGAEATFAFIRIGWARTAV